MSLIGLAGLIIGGAGRLGVPIVKSIFEFYREKQEIEKLRIQSNITQSSCNKQFECKFNPDIIYPKGRSTNSIEKKEPKRFLFIVFIFLIAVMGVGIDLIFQFKHTAPEHFYQSMEILRDTSYEIIGFVIAWVFTGALGADKINFRK